MERLLEIVPASDTDRKFLFIAYLGERAKDSGKQLARYFRRHGIETLIEYKDRSLKNQLARANRLGAAWTLVVGEDEVAKGRYQLKIMESGEQKEALAEEILAIIHESFV